MDGQATIKPCLQDIRYDAENDDQLPTTPVLSILQFTFRPGVDISQLSPISTLWHRSLEFVATIPGFQGLHWAPVNQVSAPQEIIVLIQWDSGLAWRSFQCSAGFSMLLGHLTTSWNRCLQLSLPDTVSNSKSLLELACYQFPPTPETPDPLSSEIAERKQAFKIQWETALLPLVNANSKLISATGEWLERDDRSENLYFVGLLFWQPDMQPNSPQQLIEANTHELATHLKQLSESASTVLSSITTQLNHISTDSPPTPTPDPTDNTALSNLKHPISKATVKRQYILNIKTSHVVTYYRTVYSYFVGSWYRMGSINEHHRPQQPHFSPKPVIEMIYFRCERGSEHVERAFKDLRLKVWDSCGHPVLRWGIDSDNDNAGGHTGFSLLIDLEDLPRRQREKAQTKLQDLVEEFSKQCGDKLLDLSQSKVLRPVSLDSIPTLEIAEFHVSDDKSDRCSFSYALANYNCYVSPSIHRHQEQKLAKTRPGHQPNVSSKGWH